MEQKKLKGLQTLIIGEYIIIASAFISILSFVGVIVSLVGLFSLASVAPSFKKARNWRIVELITAFIVFIGAVIAAFLATMLGGGVMMSTLIVTVIGLIAGGVITLLVNVRYTEGFIEIANNFGEGEIADKLTKLKKYFIILKIAGVVLVSLSALVTFLEIFAVIMGFVVMGITIAILIHGNTLHDKIKNGQATSSNNYAYNVNNSNNQIYNQNIGGNPNSPNNYNYNPESGSYQQSGNQNVQNNSNTETYSNQTANPTLEQSQDAAKNRDEIYKQFEGK